MILDAFTLLYVAMFSVLLWSPWNISMPCR